MSDMILKIELLYFDGCPSWENARDILIGSLKKLSITRDIKLIAVETEQEAVENQFTGSPMIRLNGEDLFPTGQTGFTLGCRVYQTPEGLKGWPTEEMILDQIERFLSNKRIYPGK
jgi:hypothetical protein